MSFEHSPESSHWRLIFSDTFDSPALDTTKWNWWYSWWNENGGTNNDELEWYQRDDVLLQNGHLRLRAQRRSVNGYAYTSGMISSHGKFEFRYGYMEIRCKIPKGRGLWPAFWALGSSGPYAEIDVLEILGHEPNRVHMNLHYAKDDSGALASHGANCAGANFANDYHLFAVRWQPERITWYVDGVERHRVSQHVPTQPMYLIANLAVGGRWPSAPDRQTPFPSYFDIAYIKVWQGQD